MCLLAFRKMILGVWSTVWHWSKFCWTSTFSFWNHRSIMTIKIRMWGYPSPFFCLWLFCPGLWKDVYAETGTPVARSLACGHRFKGKDRTLQYCSFCLIGVCVWWRNFFFHWAGNCVFSVRQFRMSSIPFFFSPESNSFFNSRKVGVALQVPSSAVVLNSTDTWKSFLNFRDLSSFYFLFAVAVNWHRFPQSFKAQPHTFNYRVTSFFLCILWRGGSRKCC